MAPFLSCLFFSDEHAFLPSWSPCISHLHYSKNTGGWKGEQPLQMRRLFDSPFYSWVSLFRERHPSLGKTIALLGCSWGL
jgi:hypothetical protein